MRSIASRITVPCLTALAALTLAVPASAQQSGDEAGLGSSFSGLQLEGDKPISIESAQLDVDDTQGQATFTGDVQVDQGPTQLRTGKLIVYYDKEASAGGGNETPTTTGALAGGSSQISRLVASEKVYVKSADQVATAQKAEFDMKSQVVVMTGDVVLSQGKNVAEGCRLTIQMETGLARLQSSNCADGGGSGRVRMMLTPGEGAGGQQAGN